MDFDLWQKHHKWAPLRLIFVFVFSSQAVKSHATLAEPCGRTGSYLQTKHPSKEFFEQGSKWWSSTLMKELCVDERPRNCIQQMQPILFYRGFMEVAALGRLVVWITQTD